MKVVLETHRAY